VGGNPAPEFLDIGYLLFQRTPKQLFFRVLQDSQKPFNAYKFVSGVISMTFEEAIDIIEKALFPEQLTTLQKEILRHVWIGESYLQMSFKLQYNHGYVKDVGAGLWRRLSEIFGEKVRKHNLRTVLAQYQQRQTLPHTQVDQALTVFVAGSGDESESGLDHGTSLQSNLQKLYQQALNAPQPMVAVLDVDNIDGVASDIRTGLISDLKHHRQEMTSVDLLQNVLSSWAAHSQTSQSLQTEALLTHLLKALGQKTCLLIVKP
jgi:hypothetical protein